MDFDLGFFMLALIFGAVGFVYFSYGRKQARISMIISGLLLMVYPYVLDSKVWLVVIGLILSLVPRFI
jgi:hypothetical protein